MVAVFAPSSDASGSVAVSVTAGSSAIVTVAVLPSAEKTTVSGPSTKGLKIGVKVTVAVVWSARMRTVKPPGADVTSVGLLMV